jgi:hypothetical protein
VSAGLLDKFVSKGAAKLAEGEWVQKGAERLMTDVSPKLPTELRPVATAVAGRLVNSKSALGTVSAHVFTSIVAYFGLGLEEEARLLFLREAATHDQRQDALRAATDVAARSAVVVAEAWVEVKRAALDVLVLAGRQAIPLLLAL